MTPYYPGPEKLMDQILAPLNGWPPEAAVSVLMTLVIMMIRESKTPQALQTLAQRFLTEGFEIQLN